MLGHHKMNAKTHLNHLPLFHSDPLPFRRLNLPHFWNGPKVIPHRVRVRPPLVKREPHLSCASPRHPSSPNNVMPKDTSDDECGKDDEKNDEKAEHGRDSRAAAAIVLVPGGHSS